MIRLMNVNTTTLCSHLSASELIAYFISIKALLYCFIEFTLNVASICLLSDRFLIKHVYFTLKPLSKINICITKILIWHYFTFKEYKTLYILTCRCRISSRNRPGYKTVCKIDPRDDSDFFHGTLLLTRVQIKKSSN